MISGYPIPNDARPPGWRSLTSRLADICRADGARFAYLVRCCDAMVAQGWDRDEALERLLEREEGPDRPQ